MKKRLVEGVFVGLGIGIGLSFMEIMLTIIPFFLNRFM